MPLTAEIAAQQIKDRLQSIRELVTDIDQKHKNISESLAPINASHAQILRESSTSSSSASTSSASTSALSATVNLPELKSKCEKALNENEKEEEVLRLALQKIFEIRNIHKERRILTRQAGNIMRKEEVMKMLFNVAKTLPLFVGKPGEKPPPLCGAIPADNSYIANKGTMVAANVKFFEEGKAVNNWILAEVIQFNTITNKYKIDDICEEKLSVHEIPKNKIIPLPLMRADPKRNPEALYALETEVLALYPRTSCFYKAKIGKLPIDHTDEYELLFVDKNYATGYSDPIRILQSYVVAPKRKPAAAAAAAAQ